MFGKRSTVRIARSSRPSADSGRRAGGTVRAAGAGSTAPRAAGRSRKAAARRFHRPVSALRSCRPRRPGRSAGTGPQQPSSPSFRRPSNSRHSESYYEIKGTIFGALIEAIDLAQLAKLDADSAREEIRDIVNEIIAIKNIVMSISEQEELLDDICNDVLGYGPLEPLLARDDIADIMVNGSGTIYIEVKGKIQKTGIRFRDNQQLLNICQRIVSQIGRRVDEILADLRRAPARRLPRQRHRAAARDRRAGAHHPQIQEGQAHARAAGQVRHRSRPRAPRSSRSSAAAGSTPSSPAAPARARRRCSIA